MDRHIEIHSFADVDRSGKVRWTACELGYEVEEKRVHPRATRDPEYLGINPYAQVPTARLDGQVLIESSAICLILAERHPESGLIPEGGVSRRIFWQKVALATTTLEQPVVHYLLARRGIVDGRWIDLVGENLQWRLNAFARDLPAAGYLVEAFSLADIFAAYVLRLAIEAELLALEGVLAAYMDRLGNRPAAGSSRFFDSLSGKGGAELAGGG